MVYLLFYHLALESNSTPPIQFADVQTEIQELASHRQNIQLHLNEPVLSTQALGFTRIYYTAAYLIYPHRVFVGKNDQIINFPDQLLANDHVPAVNWMTEHQIDAVCIVFGIGLAPHLQVIPLP